MAESIERRAVDKARLFILNYFEKIDREESGDVMLKQLGYAYERLGKSYIYGRHGIKVDVVIGNEYLDKATNLYEYMKNR